MIVNIKVQGQLANQLFLFSNLIAHGLNKNIPIANIAFYKYHRLFPKTDVLVPCYPGRAPFWLYLLSPFRSDRASFFVTRLFRKTRLFENIFLDLKRGNKFNLVDSDLGVDQLVFIHGWLFRSGDLLMKYHPEIKAYFTPKQEVVERCRVLIDSIKSKGTTIVGCHIRRGDYRNFENGIHFFEWSYYSDVLKQIALDNLHEKIHFLLFSDEQIPLAQFEDVLVSAPQGDAISDLYSLAFCDYIIGPPSTFSMWASYWGGVPLKFIKKDNPSYGLNLFQVYPNMQ